MDANPYQPPQAAPAVEARSSTIAYREFTGKAKSFRLTSTDYRREVRSRALAAIAEEIGPANVISIAEHHETFGAFTIVVWYRLALR